MQVKQYRNVVEITSETVLEAYFLERLGHRESCARVSGLLPGDHDRRRIILTIGEAWELLVGFTTDFLTSYDASPIQYALASELYSQLP